MELKIEGMSCNHCVMQVKMAISNFHGVNDIDVKVGSASFTMDDASKLDDIKAAINDAGYQVV